MDKIFIAVTDWNRQDMAGNFSGKGQLASRAVGAILSHEQAAASRDPADCAEESAAASHLSMGRHLDRGAHPGKLPRLGDDGVIGLEDELEHRHCGANNIALHEQLPSAKTSGALYHPQV